MAKCVEVQWGITPFRSAKFVELWRPYAELAINYGATGYALFRCVEDDLIVRQYAFFETKPDWERYWNSRELREAREAASGMYQVPIVYLWHDVITQGSTD